MRGREHGGFSGRKLNQYPQELRRFAKLMRDEGVRSYLEIGCRWGDTLHYVGMSMPEGSRVVGVDLPGIKTGGIRYKVQGSEPYLDRAAVSLRTAGRDAHLIVGNSRDATTIEKAKALGPFDMLLIDGDHTREGVDSDWKNYGPLARMVAFHDIKNGNAMWGVGEFFAECAKGRRSHVISINERRRGIGVLWN